jgi:hypothetical protein
MNTEYPRTWTAKLEISGLGEADVPASPYNLQRDQLKTAIAEAATWLRQDPDLDVYIQLYKTTKAHGTVKDQHWSVFICPRTGKVRAQH